MNELTITAYNHMYIFIIQCHSQNQAAGKWLVIFILFYDFSICNTVYNILYSDPPFCKPDSRMFRNRYSFRYIYPPQFFNIQHFLLLPFSFAYSIPQFI